MGIPVRVDVESDRTLAKELWTAGLGWRAEREALMPLAPTLSQGTRLLAAQC